MTHCARTGKLAYATAQEAWAVIRARKNRGSRKYRGDAGKTYVCPACKAWHITHEGALTPARLPWEVQA